jgi:hypothetical protein
MMIRLPWVVVVALAGVAAGAAVVLVLLRSQPAAPQPTIHTIYCKHVPDTWQPVRSMLDGPALGTPAQVCASLDLYKGDTWVPVSGP